MGGATNQFINDEGRIPDGLQVLRSESVIDWSKKAAQTFDFAGYRPRADPPARRYRVHDGQVRAWDIDLDERRPTLFSIPNATVPCGKGMVATEDGAVLWLASADGPPGHAGRSPGVVATNADGDALCQRFPGPFRVIPEAIYVYFGSKYFGAILHGLTSLALAREMLGPDVPLVTQARGRPSPLVAEAIRQLGFSHPDPIVLSEKAITRVERLWVGHVPTEIGATSIVCPVAYELLRRRLGVGEAEKGPERIYISRADATYRRVRNEDEVMAMLDSYGFTRLEFSRLNLAQRLSALSAAKMVVGPIGSNMSNLVFAPSDTWVIELLPGAYEAVPGVGNAVATTAYTNNQNYIRAPSHLIGPVDQEYVLRTSNQEFVCWDMDASLTNLRAGVEFAIDQAGLAQTG